MPNTENSSRASLKFLLRALHSRNYRLFFGGQGLSLIGTWMQQIAISWLAYRLSDSPFLLGLIGFSGQLPTFLLAPFAGVFADRFERCRLLMLTQLLSLFQALLLAFLTFTGYIAIWHLVVLSVFLGLVNALDIPVRQSFVIDLVEDKKDLGNAIALNSVMFNGARLVGPSIAGLLIGIFGEAVCFLVNGISFFAIVIALAAMKVPERSKDSSPKPFFHGLREGYLYTFGFEPIRYIILFLGLISLMGSSYLVLMPVFARDILHGGPYTLGFLMGATGIGALIGAIFLASRKTVRGLGRLMIIAPLVFGISLIIFSFSRTMAISLIVMLSAGFGMIVHMASSNTVLQTIVEEDKRGRMMSFYTMAFMGMATFGSLLAGTLADTIGAPATIGFSGVTCCIGAVLFSTRLSLIRKLVRPIYIRMGIIREMPTEIQQ
ncbi:MAG: MFS transporter [Syntrophorhabdus sp.]